MIKNLDEINAPSAGTKLLQSLKETPEVEDVSTIIKPPEIEEKTPVVSEDTNNDVYSSMIKDGVEVVDVKAIERNKKSRTGHPADRYHFGIPKKS